jgi:hypothetical protein
VSDIPEKCQIEFKSTPRKSARKPQKIKMLWAGSRHSAGQMCVLVSDRRKAAQGTIRKLWYRQDFVMSWQAYVPEDA